MTSNTVPIHTIALAEAARHAGQIGSLARAANCIASGSSLGSSIAAAGVVLDLLDVIECLSVKITDVADSLERGITWPNA